MTEGKRDASNAGVAPGYSKGLSFVVLAYDEESSIADAIADCRSFARRRGLDYEVIVVDDGSRDRTAAVAREVSEGDVRVLTHHENLGMGASMRDGYLAARMEYIAHLPGDRQVRAECLEMLWPVASRYTIALSTFINPPSGLARAAMSSVFRLLTRHVAGLRVNFAGTYLFHRDWLETVDLSRADSNSFLFSFQLLELFRRSGAEFVYRKIATYPREHGTSREATVSRIVAMAREVAAARMESVD